MLHLAASLIGLASPTIAQEPAVFTLDEALGIALEIAQSWPDEITTLRDIMANGRDVDWVDLLRRTQADIGGGGLSGGPWNRAISEISLQDAMTLTCARVDRERLALLRELDRFSPGTDAAELWTSLGTAPEWIEIEGAKTAWRFVPPEAAAAQFCLMSLVLDRPFDPAAPPPDVLVGLFDEIGDTMTSDGSTGETWSLFARMFRAADWRGPGPSGGIELVWFAEEPFSSTAATDPLNLLTVTVASWLAPLGS